MKIKLKSHANIKHCEIFGKCIYSVFFFYGVTISFNSCVLTHTRYVRNQRLGNVRIVY